MVGCQAEVWPTQASGLVQRGSDTAQTGFQKRKSNIQCSMHILNVPQLESHSELLCGSLSWEIEGKRLQRKERGLSMFAVGGFCMWVVTS